MNAIDVANQYFTAWNQRDAKALLESFAKDGAYRDPTTQGELTGAAIAQNARALWRAFPDLSFEIVSVAETRPGCVAAEWMMRGTNTDEFRSLPATGKAICLPGADFITIEGGKVRSVTGYFDTHTIPEQLGLQVVVQPFALGPFAFGTSTSVQTGKKAKPGAFSITQIVNSTDDEVLETRNRTRDTAREMMNMEGFIGLITARIGNRGVTIAAWERPEQPQQMMRSKAHGQAMNRAFSGSLAASAYTSIWALARMNATWVRCDACRKVSDFKKVVGLCPCGERLPDPPAYW